MLGLGRRGLRILALVSPLWAFGCFSGATVVPDLEFEAGGTGTGTPLYPTGVDILVDVAGPARTLAGGSCDGADTTYNNLTLVNAQCGPNCTVAPAGEGTLTGSVRLRVRASTPGEKVLRVEVDDEEEGAREHGLRLEFAEVGQVEVVHQPAGDPGTTAPMLVGMRPNWCVQADASDGRRLLLERSENRFESLTSPFILTDSFGDPGRVCWPFAAVLAGDGHIRISAAGRSLEHFPRVVADADIAEIHLHQLIDPPSTAMPVDFAQPLDGREYTELVLEAEDLPLELVVRLLTVSGEVARGGAERFDADRGVAVGASGDQVISLSRWGATAPEVTCLRAAIGTARIDVPLYIGTRPGSVDPCADESGVGGAGGFGGEGG